MGYFEVIKRDGTTISLLSKEPFCVVKSATQETTLMGDDVVKMSVISTELLNFEKGDKIEVGGYAYTIRTAVSREMIAESHYLYEITFYGAMYDLMRVVYRDTDLQGRSSKNTFDLTYSAREFVNVLMNNLNRDFKGEWKFDLESCPETDTRTIQFAKQNCLQALQRICSEFSLEFCIYQKNGVKTLKVGYFGETINPLSSEKFFEWGRGLGLYSLKEDKVDENSQITRLWVEGSANNIKTDYRGYAGRLQLPYPRRKNKMGHRLFDGSFVQPNTEYIGISNDSERFIEDHALRISGGSEEDVAIYDDIYPHRTGSVTGVVNNDINAFVDAMMDFDLTEKTESGTKYLIDGVSAKITFISGKLSGQQFELAKKNGYNHSQRKFVLIPAEDGNGGFIPTPQNTSLRIAVGDKYKITDILLPQSYIDDAEEILWYKANKDFEERKQRRVQYQLTLDRLYLLEHSNNHEDVIFRVGDYIPVKDERFKVEGNIRVQKVVRNLLLEQDYTLTLSNSVSRGRSAQILSNLLQLNDNVKELPSKSWIYSSLVSKASIDELARYATIDFTQLSLEKKAEKDDLVSIRNDFNDGIHSTVSSVFEARKSELKGKDGAPALINLVSEGNVPFRYQGKSDTPYQIKNFVLDDFSRRGNVYTVVAKYRYNQRNNGDVLFFLDGHVNLLHRESVGDVHIYQATCNHDLDNSLRMYVRTSGLGGDFGDIDLEWICMYKGEIANPPLTYMPSRSQIGVPARENIFNFKDRRYNIYQNDNWGAWTEYLGIGRLKCYINNDKNTKNGERLYSAYINPPFDNDEKKLSVVSFRVVESSKPIVPIGGFVAPDGRICFATRNKSIRPSKFSFTWGEHRDAVVGDYAILEDFSIQIIREGEPILPTPYAPHLDDLKVTADEVSASLIASSDFKANLSVSTAQLLNNNTEFKKAVKGEKGDKGERGLQGVQGVPGAKGAKGADGKSVTIADLKANASFMQHTAREVAKFGEFATTVQLNGVQKFAIRPRAGLPVTNSDNPFVTIINTEEAKVLSLLVIEGTDLYLPPASDCAVGTKIYLTGGVMSCSTNPTHSNTQIRPIRLYSSARDVYFAGQHTDGHLLQTFTNAEWRVDLECIVSGCGLKGWLWTNRTETTNIEELETGITTIATASSNNAKSIKSLAEDMEALKAGEHKIKIKSLRNASIVSAPLNTLQMTHDTTANSLYLPSPSEGLSFRLWANHWVNKTITIRKPSFPSENFLINTATNTQISSLTLIAGHLYDFVAVSYNTWIVTDLSR